MAISRGNINCSFGKCKPLCRAAGTQYKCMRMLRMEQRRQALFKTGNIGIMSFLFVVLYRNAVYGAYCLRHSVHLIEKRDDGLLIRDGNTQAPDARMRI